MNPKTIEGRVFQITEGAIRAQLRKEIPGSNSFVELDVSLPLAVILGFDLSGKLVVDQGWIADNLGSGIVGLQQALEAPKVRDRTLLESTPEFRKLAQKYHPDRAHAGLFSANEVMSDLNALADSLKYTQKENGSE